MACEYYLILFPKSHIQSALAQKLKASTLRLYVDLG
jgi:hypothetical protein